MHPVNYFILGIIIIFLLVRSRMSLAFNHACASDDPRNDLYHFMLCHCITLSLLHNSQEVPNKLIASYEPLYKCDYEKGQSITCYHTLKTKEYKFVDSERFYVISTYSSKSATILLFAQF